MAGSYPNVPGRRMATDEDGTVVFFRDVSAGENDVYDGTDRAIITSEEPDSSVQLGPISSGSDPIGDFVAMVFPEARDIVGVYLGVRDGGTGSATFLVETSQDSTNGIDGSWTTFVSGIVTGDTGPALEAYRTDIASGSAASVVAVRARVTANSTATRFIHRFHVYGTIASGQTPQRLEFVTAASDLITADQDYGDIPQGSSESSFTFRLRNMSDTDTAENIVVGTESLFGSSDSWYEFSIAAGPFQSTVAIESIGPEAESGVITVRRITPGGAALGLHAARIQVEVDTWT